MPQTDSRRVSFTSSTISPLSSSPFVTANTVASRSRTHSDFMSNRPNSGPDFSTLMDASKPIFEPKTSEKRSPEKAAGHSRKTPSMSQAVNGELHPPKSPYRQTHGQGKDEDQAGAESLFYAYALKSDYVRSPPYLLTFATSDICSQWWSVVQREYPESTRPGAQLFVLKTDDMASIQDDPKFFELRNKWFYTSQDRSNCATPVIPLQGSTGHLISRAPLPQQPQPAVEKPAKTTAVDSLAEKLERLSSIVESSAEHIQALTAAQSAGLKRMQQISETNNSQIKTLAQSQAKLQALIDKNASQYVTLSNASSKTQEQATKTQEQATKTQEQVTKSQEQVKAILQTTTAQIQSLSGSQAQLTQTCKTMMRSIESFASSLDHMTVASPPSPPASSAGSASPPPSFSIAPTNRIGPAPRKLNKRIKGVWYDCDDNAIPIIHGAPKKLAPAPVLKSSSKASPKAIPKLSPKTALKTPATPPRTPPRKVKS